jgi:hypothetical protein
MVRTPSGTTNSFRPNILDVFEKGFGVKYSGFKLTSEDSPEVAFLLVENYHCYLLQPDSQVNAHERRNHQAEMQELTFRVHQTCLKHSKTA